MDSSLFAASNSESSHFEGHPRVNSHCPIVVWSVLSSWMIVPETRVILLPRIHSSRHLRRPEPLQKPCFMTSGDHLVAPTSMNVVSFAPPSRTGTTSVS